MVAGGCPNPYVEPMPAPEEPEFLDFPDFPEKTYDIMKPPFGGFFDPLTDNM